MKRRALFPVHLFFTVPCAWYQRACLPFTGSLTAVFFRFLRCLCLPCLFAFSSTFVLETPRSGTLGYSSYLRWGSQQGGRTGGWSSAAVLRWRWAQAPDEDFLTLGLSRQRVMFSSPAWVVKAGQAELGVQAGNLDVLPFICRPHLSFLQGSSLPPSAEPSSQGPGM